jgi:hypothetical protein
MNAWSYLPVEPKPPTPRTVSSSSCLSATEEMQAYVDLDGGRHADLFEDELSDAVSRGD